MVGYAHNWGEHRVFFKEAGEDRIRSLPASWTDVEGPDPLLALAGGRAFFRVEDLLALVGLVQELAARHCKANSAASVRRITPGLEPLSVFRREAT